MMNGLRTIWALALAWAIGGAAISAEQEVFTDPAQAGPDYAVQGEYLGELDVDGEEQTWGGQVVALGDGQFDLAGYQGGLPGQGWRRGDRQEKASGQRRGQVVSFAADEWTATIRDGVLTVFASSGRSLGQLKRVERKSPTLGAAPPRGAVVLFDGRSAENFQDGELVEGNLLAAHCTSVRTFRDHHGHLEFRTPFKPKARGQARGNSGMYLESRYEVQILDSFGLEGLDNECGGIYQVRQPSVNMCYPPLTWQTYDYDFTAARYNDRGEKIQNARLTLRHNGVVIHDDLELPGATPGKLREGPEPAGLYLQGHGNPVVFRNIWVVER